MPELPYTAPIGKSLGVPFSFVRRFRCQQNSIVFARQARFSGQKTRKGCHLVA